MQIMLTKMGFLYHYSTVKTRKNVWLKLSVEKHYMAMPMTGIYRYNTGIKKSLGQVNFQSEQAYIFIQCKTDK